MSEPCTVPARHILRVDNEGGDSEREVTMSTVITGDSRLRVSDLDHRIHDVGWGLLLALTGVIWMIPAGKVPEGAWLVGVAAILLGAAQCGNRADPR